MNKLTSDKEGAAGPDPSGHDGICLGAGYYFVPQGSLPEQRDSPEMPVLDARGCGVMVVAPAEEAKLAVHILTEADMQAWICPDSADVVQRLGHETNALLIAEETLATGQLSPLLDLLRKQEPWSDIPVIILTGPGGAEGVSGQTFDLFGPAASLTLLERPIRPVTLVTTAKAALHARRRQREIRDLVAERDTVLASISDAFSALDRNFRYTYVNDKVAELAGMPKEKIVGQVIWDVFPEAVNGEFKQRCQHVMKTRQADYFELFYQPWNCWLEIRIHPAPNGIVIFHADNSERKEQETRLQENERKLKELEERVRLAVEAADVGTFDFYPPTGELKWSNRCNEIFGLPPNSRVTYASYVRGVHPEDRQIIHDTVQGVLRPGGTTRYDIEYRVIDQRERKERWVSEKGRAVLDSGGHAIRFIGTILDITNSKNAAIALQRAKEQAEDSNRAKDQFLAMLSHELRTPLTPILATVHSLRREPNLSNELSRELELLQRNVELEALLIDDLLDLTRIAHGKLELYSAAANVHSAIEHALSIATVDLKAKNLQVTCRLEAVEHHCWADAARLQQVFWNVIKNAIKFTPDGGAVEIRTHNDGADQIITEISDTGAGIEPEMQSRIFDAFEQGGPGITSKYGGLGLGLAISKRVIDLHQGKISVQSAGHGQGSTFVIALHAMETSLLEGAAAHPLEENSKRPAAGKTDLPETR